MDKDIFFAVMQVVWLWAERHVKKHDEWLWILLTDPGQLDRDP